MKAIGFFAQRDAGALPGPDLLEALAQPLPETTREAVVRYLDAGSVLAATPSRVVDVLHPERGEVSGENIRTDGFYLWPEDLAYYVAEYGARPPADFLERVEELGTPTELDVKTLTSLIPAARQAMAELRGDAPRAPH